MIESLSVIHRLHDQAGSTSWLYVSWTSQLDVCSMLAGCLLDVCYALCMLHICSMFARSCKRDIRHIAIFFCRGVVKHGGVLMVDLPPHGSELKWVK